MISRINLLKRKEGLTAEEFAAYLTQAHGELLATMPFLKGCETNVVVDNEQRSPFDRGSTEIDGYTEMFFDSYGDMVRGMAALEEALATDYAQFAAPGIPALVAVKKVDTPVPAYLDDVKLIKRMSFLGRKDGVSAAVFQDEWWQMHSALVKTMTGYAGYNQNLVIDRIVDGESVPFEELPIEGVVEFWFENMKAFGGFESCNPESPARTLSGEGCESMLDGRGHGRFESYRLNVREPIASNMIVSGFFGRG